MSYIKWFNTVTMADVALVGGKNASLGEMIQQLQDKAIRVPNGFATTSAAYWHFIEHNSLQAPLVALLDRYKKTTNKDEIAAIGTQIRTLIGRSQLPQDLAQEITDAYNTLCKEYGQENLSVAVRSSATAEDLPHASFAGQQDTFLNVTGSSSLLEYCVKSYASLFTDRALFYRKEKGFDDSKIALSIGIQKMVRSDTASSGVAFSLDTDTGFKDVVVINASFGLGEALVQGLVNPDEYWMFKPTFKTGHNALIKKRLGDKRVKIIFDKQGTQTTEVPDNQARTFCLTDSEIATLTEYVLTIENHYAKPMDVEWAKDGSDGQLYIVQARPETVFGATQTKTELVTYQLSEKQEPILSGQSIGSAIASGTVRVIESAQQSNQVQEGDIIVTTMTDPDWVPALKKAAGIITVQGGRTCHAAIVSRELGISAIVGASDAIKKLQSGELVTLDCSQGSIGFVYKGAVDFKKIVVPLERLPKLPVKLLMNIADPDTAFARSFLPVDGVGLARIEFIISNFISIHPMAIMQPNKITDAQVKQEIEQKSAGYKDPQTFYVETLAQGIACIAAAFYPRPVIVRLTDFKTNEYRNLIGGSYFEPQEENPMLGWRGASRYYDEQYAQAFALECDAIKRVRQEMGLTNVKLLVPFVRTVAEAKKVIEQLQKNGLQRGKHTLEILMMVEIPSNVLLIEQFSTYFDGFSIGSNDLTQLTLGLDRDSAQVAPLFDERDPAVVKLLTMAIEGAHISKKYIGICGQAPSDYPELADELIKKGIDSISLNHDAIVPFIMRFT